MLKQRRYAERVSGQAGVYMAAALEYVASEMLEIAGAVCQDEGKHLITPKHLNLGLRSDEEFSKLISSVMISQGGTKVFVHEALQKKKAGKKEPEPSQHAPAESQ